jgi:aryl-alcohol dehydrogenase-like predicted oxidoreductase
LRPIAADHQITVPQLAIAWVLHQKGVIAAIAGSRNPSHVRQNAEAADLTISETILAQLEAVIPLGPTVAAGP